MRIGPYELSAIETGWMALDGGAMFGVVPRALWSRHIAPDDRGRIGLALRALLIEEVEAPGDSRRKILVDTGIGQKWDDKGADMFGVDHTSLELEQSLAARGLGTADITDVLLTHLHFDHAGGATKKVGDAVVPTFPNATYHVQKANLAWAQAPTDKDRASYRAENFDALLREGVLELLDGPGEWLPGIELILSDGHTRAMQLPHIHGPEGHVAYCADLIPTSVHVPTPWVMAYDNFPLTTMEEKRAILERATTEDWTLFFEHDPFGPAAKVATGKRGYQVGARVELG
jgi:glyoxylase-like metal-dependent hydrolase (beta-lactamase superfamily II)